MIKWKDAKEVKPNAQKNIVLLDKFSDLFSGYYCSIQDMFFYTHMGEEYHLPDVTHWDYFEYPQ